MGFGALLALLALTINALSPPGFMMSRGQGGPAIVICTGHGPATLPGHGDGPGHTTGHQQVCPFAGHGLASSPPPLAVIARDRFAREAIVATAGTDLAPGRGLAAPPPPSQAPPIVS
jgi:hypothetical protein